MQKMMKKVTMKPTIISHGRRTPGANHLREDEGLVSAYEEEKCGSRVKRQTGGDAGERLHGAHT